LKISQQRDICSRTWRGLSINYRSIRWQKTCSLCATSFDHIDKSEALKLLPYMV